MVRRSRVREKLVNPIQLGWVRSWAAMDWSAIPADTEVEISNRHFQNRQRRQGVVPQSVNEKLKRAVLAPSALEDVEYPDFDNRHHKFSIEWLQCKIAKDVRLFRIQERKNMGNLALFHRELEGIKRIISKMPVPEWFRNAVLVPIGPEKILKFISEEVQQTLGSRQFVTLTYNNHNTSVVVIEAKHDAHLARRQAIAALGPCYSEKKELELSAPNSGYSMLLKYGQQPEYISGASESPYVICIDDVKMPPSPTKQVARRNTENRLKSRIRSTRLMSISENRWVENRTKRVDLLDKKLRVIEFYSAEDKMRCLERTKSLETIDLMYNPMMFNHEEVYETAFLKIQYDIRPLHREGVKVTVVYEYDKDFTEAAFTKSGLRVYYFDDNNEEKDQLRLSPQVKSMVCQEFPKHLKTFDDRKWFIELIAAKNDLEIEAIEPHVEEWAGAFKTLREAKQQDLKGIIDYEIYKVAHHNKVFRPMDIPWNITQNGGRGARFYADVVMTRPDVPWHAIRQTTGPKKHDELYSVHFKSAEDGLKVIRDILELSYKEPVFRCDKNDYVGPTLIPVYRKMTPISRRMRAAFNTAIRDFDDHIRITFPSLSESEDPLMEVPEAAYYSVRVYEDWSDPGETGLIGVEGWNCNGIRHFFARLQKLLKPIEFPAAQYPELLFGIGEIWVKNHEKHFQVLIDVDKFRQIISIFGSRADEVVEELLTYQEKKSSINVHTRLPTFFPLFNDFGREVLDVRTLQKLSANLNAKAVLDPKSKLIEFSGTIEAYLEFTKALDTISAEVFKRFTRVESMECPACFCETDVTSDFFRFHCGHEMCRPCLNNMVSANIDEMELKIKCPQEGCTAYLTPQELLSIILGSEDRIRELDVLKLSKMISRTKETLVAASEGKIASCPTVDCVGIRTISPGDRMQFKKCSACQMDYCRECLQGPHPDESCYEYANLRKPDVSIATYVRKQKNTKNCPRCGIWVQKSSGCNHIECKCGTHFCWICLFVAKDSSGIYGHMSTEHNSYGGDFEMVNGRLRARPGNEELQDELNMQQLMLGDMNEFVPGVDPAPIDHEADPPRIRFPVLPPGLVLPVFVPPPMPLDTLPQELIDEFPAYFTIPHIRDHALMFLNNVENIQERWNNLEELRRWPDEMPMDIPPPPGLNFN